MLAASQPNLIEIIERAMHASPSEWLFFRELRVGTGRQNGGAQRLPAPWRDTPGPTWQLVAAILHNQRRRLSEEEPPPGPVQQRLALL